MHKIVILWTILAFFSAVCFPSRFIPYSISVSGDGKEKKQQNKPYLLINFLVLTTKFIHSCNLSKLPALMLLLSFTLLYCLKGSCQKMRSTLALSPQLFLIPFFHFLQFFFFFYFRSVEEYDRKRDIAESRKKKEKESKKRKFRYYRRRQQQPNSNSDQSSSRQNTSATS